MGLLITFGADYLQNRLYAWSGEASVACKVPFRKLDNHIRELCARVVSAEGDQLAPLMSELKAALQEHNNRLRQMAVAKLANPLPPRSRPSQ